MSATALRVKSTMTRSCVVPRDRSWIHVARYGLSHVPTVGASGGTSAKGKSAFTMTRLRKATYTITAKPLFSPGHDSPPVMR